MYETKASLVTGVVLSSVTWGGGVGGGGSVSSVERGVCSIDGAYIYIYMYIPPIYIKPPSLCKLPLKT